MILGAIKGSRNRDMVISDSLNVASDSLLISLNLNEIFITAAESNLTPSASVIGKQAMEHLQPTSFSDILELIPGGKTQTPDMNSASLIRLREAGSTSEVMASLGVKFVIDGIAIDNDANLQYNPSSSNERTFVSKGVDMRSIQTDNIESVEIVRGIPSVVYGDLTSGLVNIIRKSGSSPLSARVKVDEYGKLFSVGKGFKTGRSTFLNADVNYTDSKADPRLPLENYKRVTFSSRLVNNYTGDNLRAKLSLNADYTGSFDNQKNDAEITGNQYDSFKSTYNRFSLAATTKLYFSELKYFTELDLKGALTASYDRLEQTKFISLSRPMPVATSLNEGEFDGEYLPFQYVADLFVDGRPVSGNFSAIGRFDFNTANIKNKLLIGTEWKMSGNNGEGRKYDVSRPMNSTSTRPRSYKDIPFMHNIAFFAEENLTVDLDGYKLDVMAGVRTLSLLNLDSRYTMAGKVYIEPRINIRYNLPPAIISGKTLKVDFSVGAGSHIKAPTLDMLYPDARYEDIVQLNYYHNNPDYRVINYRTYCIDVTNFDLKPARNNKYELRGGVSYDGFNLSVTYFREYMNDGFRQVTDFRALYYKNYDTGSVNSSEITSKPQVSDFSYANDSVMKLYNVWDNQTKTHKEGIEFTLSTKRLEPIKTRLTINGAWFKTTTSNAGYEYYRPGTVINGRPFNYIGIWQLPT